MPKKRPTRHTTRHKTSRTKSHAKKKWTLVKKHTKTAKKTHARHVEWEPIKNRQARWNAYYKLQAEIEHVWKELQNNIKRNADYKKILNNRNRLLLLLGECNFMAHEYIQLANEQRHAA